MPKQHQEHKHTKCCQPDVINRLAETLKSIKCGDAPQQNTQTSVVQCANGKSLGRIEKRILYGSTRPTPVGCEAPGGGLSYPKETKFIFHYQIRKLDHERSILDDTRKYNKVMEIYSDKQFQIDFWEHCLGTMLPGEVASFTVPADRLPSFPAVNKKLRDYMMDKRGSTVKHCCGLMGLQEQGGLGYDDLNKLLMNPEPLEFIFELVDVNIPGSGRKDTWIMSADEQSAMVPVLREEGNQYYSSGKLDQAASCYREALGILEQLTLREKPGDPEWKELDAARVPLFVNLAQCEFKLKEYYAAVRSTTEALSRDPVNVKALYRRAKAYTETWDLDLAGADLRRVAALMPQMAAAADAELKALEVKRSEQALRERRHLAGKMSIGSAPYCQAPASDAGGQT